MPLFTVDVEKLLQQEYWTNVYHVEAPSLDAAVAAGEDLTLMERSFTSNIVQFTRTRVRTATKGDDVYQTITINEAGQLDTGPSQWLPLFNRIRADFTVVGSRPSRKFYATPLMEEWQVNGIVDAAVRNDIQLKLNARITALSQAGTPWVDVDGQPISNATVLAAVAMRQLRRGSRKRKQPVIPA
jgi:hypothetical protein